MRPAWVGLRLAWRRAVLGVALLAALISGLGSCVLQELASSQRETVEFQLNERAQRQCRDAGRADDAACLRRAAKPSGSLAQFAAETDALGARARALQTPGGAIGWAESWLLTLLGVATMIVAVAITTATDRERGRLLAGWHPVLHGRRPLLAGLVAGVGASAIVALGAVAGSAAAAVAGSSLWPLEGEPSEALVPGLGSVGGIAPTLAGLATIAIVALAVSVLCWLIGKVLHALLGSLALAGVLVVLSAHLPAWFPLAELPATAGMWTHHRGEIVHIWGWPSTPVDGGGFPSVDWTALSASDPHAAALVGSAVLLILVVIAIPFAIRRKLD